MKKTRQEPEIEILELGDDFDLREAIRSAVENKLRQKVEQRDKVQDLRRDAEQALENHLNSVDDDEAHALTDTIWNLCKDHQMGNVLMALAQTVANVICERADPDEVRATVEASPLTPEQKERALAQGLHEAECWNCFNNSVSVRIAAFSMLLNKMGAAVTGQQPDAPEHVKAVIRKATDEAYDRPSDVRQH